MQRCGLAVRCFRSALCMTGNAMNRFAASAISGFAATAPMTGAMNLMHRWLPVHERYPLHPHIISMRLAKAAGVHGKMGRRQRHALTLLNHYAYGTFAGSVFGLIAPRERGPAVAVGIGYGLFVWAGSYLGLLPALGILQPATKHPARRNALMILAHLVWGASVGVLVSVLPDARGQERLSLSPGEASRPSAPARTALRPNSTGAMS